MSWSQCQIGRKTDNPCENDATIDLLRMGTPTLCEQHSKDIELSDEESEWRITRQYIQGFAKIAEVVDIQPLDDIMDAAWAECEMRLSVLGAERRMVWE